MYLLWLEIVKYLQITKYNLQISRNFKQNFFIKITFAIEIELNKKVFFN